MLRNALISQIERFSPTLNTLLRNQSLSFIADRFESYILSIPTASGFLRSRNCNYCRSYTESFDKLRYRRRFSTETSSVTEKKSRMPKQQKRSKCHHENILWVDMEMTGLDPNKDYIMEIACIVTTDELEILDEMETIVLHQPKEILDNMNEWCVTQHGLSGLTQKSLESTVTLEEAEQRVVDFVSLYCPPNKCPVAGNSVGTDVAFLRAQMPKLAQVLHYRIIDVSSIKELCRRWYPSVFSRAPKKKLTHRALDDIRESINELVYYRANVFK